MTSSHKRFVENKNGMVIVSYLQVDGLNKFSAWNDLMENPPFAYSSSANPWVANHSYRGIYKNCWCWVANESSFLTKDEQSCYDIIT